MGSAVLDRFKYVFSIDLRTLGLFRIALSVALLFALFVLLPDIGAFYTDQGVLPRADAVHFLNERRFSLLMANGSYWFAALFFLIGIAAALCLLVGYRSRLSAFVAWIVFVSIVNRNTLIYQGGDSLLPLLLFWAMFLPIGARFGIDGALDKTRNPQPAPYFSVATIGLLLQVIYVYVFGALLKTSPQWVSDGTAIYYALHLDTFATPLGHWFRQFGGAMQALTIYVWWLELLAPLLMFAPVWTDRLRLMGQALLISMHIGFRLFLNIGHFYLASIASLLTFTPRLFWEVMDRRYWSEDQRKITVYYDAPCTFCFKVCLILREFFLPNTVRILEAQSDPEIGAILERDFTWVVTDAAGNRHTHWDALTFVTNQSLILKPVGWVVWAIGAIGLGNRLYTTIGNSRDALGAITATALPFRASVFKLGPIRSALLGFLVAVCFVWNVKEQTGAQNLPVAIPKPVDAAVHFLHLRQRWAMFAPHPHMRDAWPVIEGTTLDKQTVDVYKLALGAPSTEKPRYISHHFESYRWRKYLNRIFYRGDKQKLSILYAKYLCRRWDDAFGGRQSLKRLTITLNEARTQPGFKPRSHNQVQALSWSCRRKMVL